MKAFISNSTKNSNYPDKVKSLLKKIGIDSFIANNDIRVGQDWKNTIKSELKKADFCILFLSNDFKKSDWCSQEIGIAFMLDKIFIPLSIDKTKSYGFIENIQSKPITKNGVELSLVEGLLITFFDYGVKGIIELLKNQFSFDYSERIFLVLSPYFEKISVKDINQICHLSITNNQVWPAKDCADIYIPKLLKLRKRDIKQNLYDKLKFQIEKQEWYRD